MSSFSEKSSKSTKSKQMDMLHGPMLKNILLFAMPLALSGILQQLFTSADMAVIYWFEGSVAQSAVNSNGALVNLLINLFTGLSVGVTVVIAEYIGKNKTDDIHSIVFTSVVIALVSGVFLIGLGVGVSEPILKAMDTPTEALPLAVQYLRIYFVGMPFLMIYNFGAAILRSVGDTRKSLYILLATGVLNIGLNVLFVAAMNMNVAGVATATVLSNVLSAVLVMIFIMKDDVLKIRRKQSKFRKEYLKRICVIGIPAGLQGVVFSLANVVIQTAINGFGHQAVAGSGDAVNFEYYVYFFVSAFAQTTVSFFGQNYAAGEYERCRKIFKLNMLLGLAVSTVLSVAFTAGGRLFIRIYTTDEVAIEFAVTRMWCVLLGSMIPCFYEIAGGALRGMGHSMLPAVFTVVGSCLLRLVWVYTVFAAHNEFWVLLIVYPVSWVLTGLAMMVAYYIIAAKSFKPKPAADTEQIAECGDTDFVAEDNACESKGDGTVDTAKVCAAHRK